MKIKGVMLVILCSFLGSAAQFLFKIGSSTISLSLPSFIFNFYVMAGIMLFFIGAILFIISLKFGDLAFIYPFMSLSYIWVTLISIYFFHETVTFINVMGVVAIILGVSIIGYGEKS